jgi:hypothetical protein
MAFLVHNLPPVQCFVKREFLYDFEKGFGEYEPCIWMTIKCIKGQAFRIEALLPNYGALYDKLPLHAFVSRQESLNDAILPLDYLQIWDALSYNITVIEKDNLRMLKCKFLDKDRKWHFGEYMFTVDFCQNDPGYLNTGFSETVEEHKSYNFIKLDNGQFAAQPNNKTLFYDASLTVPEFKMPDFKIATKLYSVEKYNKHSARNNNDFFYDFKERKE